MDQNHFVNYIKINMLYMVPFLILTTVRQCTSDPDFPNNDFKPSPTPFQDWDYIVYSQRWPITGCTEWEEQGSKNTCNLPQGPTTWLVHGVWPTKLGKMGPFFCDSALHFDPDQLTPMMKDLQQYWANIEANTQPNSFWKHEWNKHGTCASSLPQLNSVTSFFRQGLEWNREYDLNAILSKNNVVPNTQGYNISLVYDTVESALGKSPTIECVVDGKSKQSLISEIRICFNKSLDLIDCNGNDGDGDVFSNCNAKENVMYLAAVPNNSTDLDSDLDTDVLRGCFERYIYNRNLMKLYNLVKFLMWATL